MWHQEPQPLHLLIEPYRQAVWDMVDKRLEADGVPPQDRPGIIEPRLLEELDAKACDLHQVVTEALQDGEPPPHQMAEQLALAIAATLGIQEIIFGAYLKKARQDTGISEPEHQMPWQGPWDGMQEDHLATLERMVAERAHVKPTRKDLLIALNEALKEPNNAVDELCSRKHKDAHWSAEMGECLSQALGFEPSTFSFELYYSRNRIQSYGGSMAR